MLACVSWPNTTPIRNTPKPKTAAMCCTRYAPKKSPVCIAWSSKIKQTQIVSVSTPNKRPVRFTGRLFLYAYGFQPIATCTAWMQFTFEYMLWPRLFNTNTHIQAQPNHCYMPDTKAMTMQKRPVRIYRPLYASILQLTPRCSPNDQAPQSLSWALCLP